MAEFSGKVAIVTGGGSGIGEAIVRELAAEGARVVVADRDQAGIDRVVAAVAAAGGTASGFSLDVASAEQNAAMVDYAEKTYGGLHLAVNNAGIGGPAALTGDYPLDGWKTVIDINLNGVFYGLRYEIPAMLRSGGGAIVNMASILGSVGFATAVAYTSAKHALLGMTKVAAMEYAARGLRVNAVGPGFIDTPLLARNLDAGTLQHIAALHPVQRLGRPEEVSALTCFLLSDRASFITGSYHLVDGGYVAQ
ncbi:MAG: short-chain dehydrogenase [Devosia sp. 67-54]|uniref:SDR family NAD(P)-dependent oxidoreductase n=1 Tax=unclassified Devosia TaxID=196773 RepID=UPI00095AD373|nr:MULTISPECIES: SDR family NAD(P)-dependent oxidoreductase [unclassified Devosia]MBN9305475.1 SDR family oxidoreductase [Devosia sp.]OJX19062.1 MAG: short-chain dehydrogenase [Devosia sp. 67-54]